MVELIMAAVGCSSSRAARIEGVMRDFIPDLNWESRVEVEDAAVRADLLLTKMDEEPENWN